MPVLETGAPTLHLLKIIAAVWAWGATPTQDIFALHICFESSKKEAQFNGEENGVPDGAGGGMGTGLAAGVAATLAVELGPVRGIAQLGLAKTTTTRSPLSIYPILRMARHFANCLVSLTKFSTFDRVKQVFSGALKGLCRFARVCADRSPVCSRCDFLLLGGARL